MAVSYASQGAHRNKSSKSNQAVVYHLVYIFTKLHLMPPWHFHTSLSGSMFNDVYLQHFENTSLWHSVGEKNREIVRYH